MVCVWGVGAEVGGKEIFFFSFFGYDVSWLGTKSSYDVSEERGEENREGRRV